MQIWEDADACPNQFLRTPPSLYIRSVQVAAGSTWRHNDWLKAQNLINQYLEVH